MATMQGFSGAMASDEVVKGAMFSYAFEHMEIAAYRNIVAAARIVGDAHTAQVCEAILAEEIAMAAWLEENMGGVSGTRRPIPFKAVCPGSLWSWGRRSA